MAQFLKQKHILFILILVSMIKIFSKSFEKVIINSES